MRSGYRIIGAFAGIIAASIVFLLKARNNYPQMEIFAYLFIITAGLGLVITLRIYFRNRR